MKAAETVTYWKTETKKTDELSKQGNIVDDMTSSHLFAAYHGSSIKTTIEAT